MLGVDEHSVLWRVDRGVLPAYRINGMFRFRRADVLEVVPGPAAGGRPAPSTAPGP